MNIEMTYYLAPLIGLITLAIGIGAMISPQKMSKNFGIAADKATLPYVVSTGVRDVFIGIIIFVLYFMKAWSALAYCNFAIALVAISDFYVVYRYGDRKTSLVHLASAIGVVTYGLWLLYLS